MNLNCKLWESSTFFIQYLDASRKHISFRVKLNGSFTYEHFMVGHFHNTFARTVNWMRSTTTERTPTTTILYCGHWKNKVNQVTYFLILGWLVGKYPHSFDIETRIKIDVAASYFISSWWKFRSHSSWNKNNKNT